MHIAGLPVKDATKQVTLTITKRDVHNGDTKNPSACAAALECKRQMGVTDVRVHIGRTYVKLDDKWLRFRTAGSLRNEIIAFDRGGKFEPGTYTLMPVPPQDRFGHRRPKPSGLGKTKRIKRAKIHVVAGVRERGANR